MNTIEAFGTTMTDAEFLARTREKKAEKKKEAEKKNRRRYKLHALIKFFTTIKAKSRQIHMTQEIYDNCAEDQKAAIKELQEKFGYNIQFSI